MADTPTTTQRVVIVNGTAEMLDLIQSFCEGGNYDVIFVESTEHAYSQIKRIQPNLIWICLDDAASYLVLTMLKLDEETRYIPVLTYSDFESEDEEESTEEEETTDEASIFNPDQAATWMN